jgi:membrane protein YdbS with pleckstrin-like domain
MLRATWARTPPRGIDCGVSNDERACPVCGETIKVVAIKCRFCGEDLEKFAATRAAEHETTMFAGHPAAFSSVNQYLWAVITLGIAALVYWIRAQSVSYEITTQRIKIERGLLSKVKDNLELFRVDHVSVEKPLGMRLLGQGRVRLVTSDQSERHVLLYGLPDFEGLAEKLRNAALKERERRGIRAFAQV